MYAWAAIHHVEPNGLRAGMVSRGEDYVWSSARAHCGLASDAQLAVASPDQSSITSWSAWRAGTPDMNCEQRIRSRTYTGRPCGSDDFVKQIEGIVGRRLAPGKLGPKPKPKSDAERML